MRGAAGARFASLALALVAPAWSAAAGPQLFKCMEGGRTVYQQQACSVTSQVDAAPASSGTKAASEPSAKVARVRPPLAPASTVLATPR